MVLGLQRTEQKYRREREHMGSGDPNVREDLLAGANWVSVHKLEMDGSREMDSLSEKNLGRSLEGRVETSPTGRHCFVRWGCVRENFTFCQILLPPSVSYFVFLFCLYFLIPPLQQHHPFFLLVLPPTHLIITP